MKRILVTAYAVNPYKGSEDGTGWNICLNLAETDHVTVITRQNNRSEIERFYQENANLECLKNLEFIYHDLPGWLIFWKKRLGDVGYQIYFYLWQLTVPFFIKRSGKEFDLAHALNFHSDSHPQFLWILGKPVFWGPIGHHPVVPKEYMKDYGWKARFKDRFNNTVKFLMRTFDPFFYISKWSARKIFVINSKINNAVKANPNKIITLPAVANNQVESYKHVSRYFEIISVGRFTYMKGFDVVIRSFAKFMKELPSEERKWIKLKLIGKGEEEEKLKTIIKQEKIAAYVEVINWVPRSEMEMIYKSASVFAFGSHEGAGMVVPEALSYGVPVICFDNSGPGELCNDNCAIRLNVGSYEESTKAFSQALHTLYQNEDEREKMSKNAVEYSRKYFSWRYKSSVIKNVHDEVITEFSSVSQLNSNL